MLLSVIVICYWPLKWLLWLLWTFCISFENTNHYMLIGIGLHVKVVNLMPIPGTAENNLILYSRGCLMPTKTSVGKTL